MENSESSPQSVIFPLGEKAAARCFTGEAYRVTIVPNNSTFNCPVCNVTSEAGARNNRHSHPGGQILLCTAGKGYYQKRGGGIRLLEAGDAQWLEAVTDEEYNSFKQETI